MFLRRRVGRRVLHGGHKCESIFRFCPEIVCAAKACVSMCWHFSSAPNVSHVGMPGLVPGIVVAEVFFSRSPALLKAPPDPDYIDHEYQQQSTIQAA